MPWLDDLVTLMEDAAVATYGVDLFVSTKGNVPLLASGTLSIVETSGSAPERTHTRRMAGVVQARTRPAYIRPAAQIMARADTYPRARALAQAAYDAVVALPRNAWIVAAREYETGDGLQSGWYREITPLQEPFDGGVDDRKQARCGFNVIGVRRPDASQTRVYGAWARVGTLPEPVSETVLLDFNSSLWVIGGTTRSVFRSDDLGQTWVTAGALPYADVIFGHAAIVFNNKMWVIGGTVNGAGGLQAKVFSSVDGDTWAVEPDLPFPVSEAVILLFNDKVWIIGGVTFGDLPGGGQGGINSLKVISTSNMATWSEVGEIPRALVGACGTVFDGKMWLFAGYDPYADESKKIFTSNNGVAWPEVGHDAMPWAMGGDGAKSVVLNNRLLLMGGFVVNQGVIANVYYGQSGLIWFDTSALPEPIGYFGTIARADTVVVAGGANDTDTLDAVYALSMETK